MKQMAIFNHKNKICGKAKNYLLKIIGGAKAPPAPPAPRSLFERTALVCSSHTRCLSSCTPKYFALSTTSICELLMAKDGVGTDLSDIFLILGLEPLTR